MGDESKLINDMEMNSLLQNKYYTGQLTPRKMCFSKIKDLNGIMCHEKTIRNKVQIQLLS